MKKNELNNKWIKLFLFLLGFVVILSGFVAGHDDSKNEKKESNISINIEQTGQNNIPDE